MIKKLRTMNTTDYYWPNSMNQLCLITSKTIRKSTAFNATRKSGVSGETNILITSSVNWSYLCRLSSTQLLRWSPFIISIHTHVLFSITSKDFTSAIFTIWVRDQLYDPGAWHDGCVTVRPAWSLCHNLDMCMPLLHHVFWCDSPISLLSQFYRFGTLDNSTSLHPLHALSTDALRSYATSQTCTIHDCLQKSTLKFLPESI
jgi:hypothetical protein